MKRFVAFLFLSTSLTAALAGCGSSSNGSNINVPARYVPISVTLQWQALPESRVVPITSSALSAKISVTDLSKTNPGPTDLVTVATVNRSTTKKTAYTQNFKTSGLVARPEHHIDAQIQFFSNLDGTGTLVGTVKKSSTLSDSGDLGDFSSASGKATTTE